MERENTSLRKQKTDLSARIEQLESENRQQENAIRNAFCAEIEQLQQKLTEASKTQAESDQRLYQFELQTAMQQQLVENLKQERHQLQEALDVANKSYKTVTDQSGKQVMQRM